MAKLIDEFMRPHRPSARWIVVAFAIGAFAQCFAPLHWYALLAIVLMLACVQAFIEYAGSH